MMGYMSAYLVMPLLVAIIRMGAMSLSRARLRNEKHSMSNMCTSSINSTCTHTHTHSHSIVYAHTHTHSHSIVYAHTHAHTHTHSHSIVYAHTHTHTVIA